MSDSVLQAVVGGSSKFRMWVMSGRVALQVAGGGSIILQRNLLYQNERLKRVQQLSLHTARARRLVSSTR